MDLPGYDAWKTRLPDYCDGDETPEDACPKCGGTGLWWDGACRDRCPRCQGTGNDEPEPEERHLTMEEALDLDQQKLDALMEAEPTDDPCQCPRCGRMHQNMGFTKPTSMQFKTTAEQRAELRKLAESRGVLHWPRLIDLLDDFDSLTASPQQG